MPQRLRNACPPKRRNQQKRLKRPCQSIRQAESVSSAVGPGRAAHGDCGGMPVKILRAILDVLTVIVLGTGVYLWLRRRKSGVSIDRAIAQTSAVEAPLVIILIDGSRAVSQTALADFRCTDLHRRARRRRPRCGACRRRLVGRRLVADVFAAGADVFPLRAERARRVPTRNG